jgi:REP element-mobilizing transposase RayT
LLKPDKKRRRTLRLPGWDYSQEGPYFITVCTRNREYFFGEIVEGLMNPNEPGAMIVKTWDGLPKRFPFLQLDARVLMPNHFHALVVLDRRGESCIRPLGTPAENLIHLVQGDHQHQGEPEVRPYGKRPRGTAAGSIGRIIQAFKSITTRLYLRGIRDCGWPPFPGKLWQRNYFEHIVRDYEEWQRICDYLAANPINWALDRENREVQGYKPNESWQV